MLRAERISSQAWYLRAGDELSKYDQNPRIPAKIDHFPDGWHQIPCTGNAEGCFWVHKAALHVADDERGTAGKHAVDFIYSSLFFGNYFILAEHFVLLI